MDSLLVTCPMYYICSDCHRFITVWFCISVNIATALKMVDPSREVGLLDADVFGPSIPLMMNLDDTPLLNDSNNQYFLEFNAFRRLHLTSLYLVYMVTNYR